MLSRKFCTVLALTALLAACGGDENTSPTPTARSGTDEGAVAVAKTANTASTPANGSGQCTLDDYQDYGGSGPLNCTANDIEIARAVVAQQQGPVQCSPGDPVNLSIDVDLKATSNEERQDIGIWISTTGTDPKLAGGTCNHYNLPTSPALPDGTVNGDGDSCSGMESGAEATVPLGSITIPCNIVTLTGADATEAGVPPGTYLKVGACVSWKVPGQDEACPDDTGLDGNATPAQSTDFRAGTIPGTPAKCNCDPFYIPAEVVGTLTIIKDAVPNDAQDFGFTGTGAGISAFSLDDDADGTLSNTKVFSNLVNNETARTVTESAVSGWDLTSINCTGATTSSVSPNVATRTVSVTLRGGEDVTCTFTNTKRASITIVKDAVPNSARDFAFTSNIPGAGNDAFSLDDDADGTLPNSKTMEVVAGTYTVTETGLPITGWDLTSIVCVDPTTNSSGVIATGVATINVAAGESVTCTYTNTQRGTVTIVKDAQPNDAEDFAFTSTFTGNAAFSLDDDADVTLSNQNVISNVVPGQYTATEGAETNWDLTSITCSDANSTGNTGTRTATFNVEAGESVTCTFVNQRKARLIIEKQTIPDGATQSFEFTRTGIANFNLTDGQQNNSGFTLAPGNYVVCELDLAVTWQATATLDGNAVTLVNPDDPADEGDRCYTVALAYGDDKIIVFTNTEPPPPGGDARTIGYWRNWSSCSKSNGKQYQKAVANGDFDKTLDGNLPQTIGDLLVDTCLEGVRIVSKQDVSNGKNMASDPAYGLAAQLLAAKLNYTAGAGQCAAATQAIADGQALLDAINFTGTGSYKNTMTAQQQSLANSLAATLDSYNNNTLCP